MVIKKDGTRKIIALLAIMALLVSSSIALAQGVDGDEVDPTKQEEPGEYNGPGDGPGDEPGEEPGEEPGDEPGEEPGEEPDEEPGEEPGEDEEPDEGEEADEDEELGGDEEPEEEPGGDEESGGDEELGGDEEFTGGKGLDGVQTLGAPAGIGTQGLIDIETIVEVNMDFSVKAKNTAIVGEEVTFIYEAKYKNIKVTINTYLGSRLIKTDTITISSPMLVDYKITDDVIGEVHSKKYFTWFPGEVVRFEKTYKVKNDDNDPLENNASLMVVGSLGGYIIPTTYFQDSANVDILAPSIEVTKSADKETVYVGDEIIYTYTITNTGDVPLYDITLTDDVIGDIALTENSLDPDETVTATDTYIAEEVGELTNTATAMGKYTIGNDECEVTDTAEFTVMITEAPVLTGDVKIIKTKVPWDYEIAELMSLSDSPGVPHQGVWFYLKQNNEIMFEGYTDEKGVLEFNGIPAGEYILEEEYVEGYEWYGWYGDIVGDTVNVNNNETAEILVLNREIKATIKVVKFLNTKDGMQPQKGVPFELKCYPEEMVLEAFDEDNCLWSEIAETDSNGEILFVVSEWGEGYYYTLREIGMEDYDVEYQDLYGDLVDVEKIQTWPGEGPTIYVINTPKGGEEPGGDDEPPSGGGGGGSSRRRPRTVEEEPVEVPEEPEVLTPPVAEEPVEEPVVVEEPMVTAPVLPALPHTGGNPAAFVIAGAALAGLGLYLRKRR